MPDPISPKKRSLMPSSPLRRTLRAAGHHLAPVVQVGKEGVTEAVLAQVDQALIDHELIKVKAGTETPDDRFSTAEALARVNEAIALYADEPEYHVWKAWLEFLVAPEPQRKAQRAGSEKAIEAALQKSPKCAAGWLFLGRMAKITGDPAAAERAWKRGVEQVKDIELERELRFLKR